MHNTLTNKYQWNTLQSIFLYFIILFLIAPIQLRGGDSYYYWDWSRHLAWSYFDGPPMIAYWIKASTLLFQDTLFALAAVAIISTGCSCIMLYKTARIFLEKKDSYEVLLFWLFSPLTTIDLLTQTTYDNPFILFWIISLYFCMQFISKNQIKYLYLTGISMGYLFLSKYSGAILVLVFLGYVVATPYRYLFRSIHFYAAIGLSFVIISPVLIWGAQHHWISFSYQLSNHVAAVNSPTLLLFANYFFAHINGTVIPPMNLLITKPFSFFLDKKQQCVTLCLLTCIGIFLFYLILAFKVNVRYNWFEPFLITSALLMPFWQHPFKKILLAIYIVISIIILFNGVFLFKKPAYYQNLRSIEALNTTYSTLPKIVVTHSWLEARSLFFIKNKPTIYTLDCNQPNQNQYLLWSKHLHDTLQDSKEFLYISHDDDMLCLKQQGYRCTAMPITHGRLLVYRCGLKADVVQGKSSNLETGD